MGIASQDSAAAIEGFVSEHGLEHVLTASDVEGEVWRRFGVVGQPTWVFVDGETGASARHLGFLSDADLAKVLSTLAG